MVNVDTIVFLAEYVCPTFLALFAGALDVIFDTY